MLEVAGDLRRAPAKFENPAPFKARLPVTPSATAWGKVGETPEFGIPSLVLSSDLALSTCSPCVVILLSFSNAANWQLIKTFLRETLSIGILSAILEN